MIISLILGIICIAISIGLFTFALIHENHNNIITGMFMSGFLIIGAFLISNYSYRNSPQIINNATNITTKVNKVIITSEGNDTIYTLIYYKYNL